VRKQRVVLEHHADAALVRRDVVDRLAAERMSPWVAVSNPASIIRQVVLPDPDGPSMVRNSPLGMEVEVFDDEHLAVIALLHAFELDEMVDFYRTDPSI
jgi:hypothetical protein